MESRPLADGKTIRLFAIGQLGWAILSGIISNWLVYYYMPSDTLVAEGMPIFITQASYVPALPSLASSRAADACSMASSIPSSLRSLTLLPALTAGGFRS